MFIPSVIIGSKMAYTHHVRKDTFLLTLQKHLRDAEAWDDSEEIERITKSIYLYKSGIGGKHPSPKGTNFRQKQLIPYETKRKETRNRISRY